ncbi:MAG: FAD-dependent oxidoreductase [Deltaproteobacteria bacterium]|nr:FAD-dependent oxidoreductase [Deltaproteobacteria bacterium]
MTHRYQLDVGADPGARFDAVVIGAGPAGAATAVQLARRGLSVALADRAFLDEAGPVWSVGVPGWMLADCGLDLPYTRAARPVGRFVVQGVSASLRLALCENPVCEVSLPRLVRELHEAARTAGVTMLDRIQVDGFEFDGDRPTTLHVHRLDRGPADHLALSASLFVDASGMSAVLRRRVPALARSCRPVQTTDLCSAFEDTREVADPDGAAMFLEAQGAFPDEHLSRTGIEGGYSTLTLRIGSSRAASDAAPDADHDAASGVAFHAGQDDRQQDERQQGEWQRKPSAPLDRVWLLAGSAVVSGAAPGRQMLKLFRRAHPWIGRRILGGGGIIPIRRPYDRLAWPGIALVGNAACQVFPTHGSGVGTSLLAAKMLADAVAGASDPGCQRALWRYQAAFQTSLGPVLGAHDVVRRFVQELSGAEQEDLVRAGLMNERSVTLALAQKLGLPALSDVPSYVGAALTRPGLTRRLAHVLARSAAIAAWYRTYPGTPDEVRLRRWSAGLARLFGVEPEIE